MTRAQYEKAKALANDERTDRETRAAAQRQVDKWRIKFEAEPNKKLHPGRVQSPEYQAWAKNMEVGNRETEVTTRPTSITMNEVLEMTAQFVEEARQSKDDVCLGAYLKMASRCDALRPGNLWRTSGAKPRRDGVRRT